MNQYPLWRYLLLAVLIIVAVIYALPNLCGEDPAIQITTKDSSALNSPISMQIASALQAQHLAYHSIERAATNVLVRFTDTETQLKAQDIIAATLGSNYSVALNLAPRTPRWLQAIGAQPMKLGLDLRGGIHFLLNVDVGAMIKAQQTGDVRTMEIDLRHARIRYSAVTLARGGDIVLTFATQEAKVRALALLRKNFPAYVVSAQGTTVTAHFAQQAVQRIQQNAVTQIATILRNRINELGVAEPVIQQQGATNISVNLPDIQDTARAKDLIGKVATVRLQLQDVDHNPAVAAQSGIVPFGTTLYTYEGQPVLLKNQIVLKGTAIISATVNIGENGQPQVVVRVSGSDVTAFNRITARNIGKPMATVYVETKTTKKLLAGKIVTQRRQVERVINIATIQNALGNNFQITGLGTITAAKNLALLLRSGAYPVPVDFIQERVVGPSLGKENIRMGVLSTEIGSLIVILFMLFYYRGFGLIADLALILNIIFIIAILSLLGATLTLPGIAGIVLTVGMAVDANVLINERIREELRNGMSPQASICAGYARAFSTIVDANITTLIVMIVLFALGSGSVQGFAVTTTVGLLCSMVTAIFFTRAVINLIYGRRSVKKLSIGIKMVNNERRTIGGR